MIGFLLIRHGESTWMADGHGLPRDQRRFGGRMNEVGLTDVGRQQSRDLGAYWGWRGIRPTQYVCSPAKRAIQTHEGCQQGMGAQPPAKHTVVINLQELTWGEWEGGLRSVAAQPTWAHQRQRLGLDFRPPGGESYNDVRARSMKALRWVAARVPDGSLVAVFTHQNVIKSLVFPWMDWNLDETMGAKVGVVSMTYLTLSGGEFQMEFFNRPTIQP